MVSNKTVGFLLSWGHSIPLAVISASTSLITFHENMRFYFISFKALPLLTHSILLISFKLSLTFLIELGFLLYDSLHQVFQYSSHRFCSAIFLVNNIWLCYQSKACLWYSILLTWFHCSWNPRMTISTHHCVLISK